LKAIVEAKSQVRSSAKGQERARADWRASLQPGDPNYSPR
jgi:hypothetical protein